MNPNDRKYTSEHEWVKIDDPAAGHAVAGITEYAQDQLGDIVYFDLPQPGATVQFKGKMGEVESVKAVSDLYSPVTGEVIEVNERLIDHPEIVNEDPFQEGWLVRVAMSNAAEVDSLMSAEEYDAFIGGLE
ncbi:MAG: glycine cleavage system protein H [SAR202 cluster bacterium Io17-Chloro-G9]|nr:MAG: glycine cleavage system protein H [SAR202 cluster bacterium Io17-Chloro-G9]